MSLVSKIERGKKPKPPRILPYGPEGIGKSTFGSQAPSPIFVQTEDGADLIEADKFPLATSYEDVSQALGDLAAEPHDFETVVLDSLDWLERLIWDQVCAGFSVKNIEKADGGYARGYLLALNYWRELLEQLNRLRNQRHMIIVLIAHAKVERFEDPEAPPYHRYSPRLHKHAAALVSEWCDAVLFATRKFRTASEDAGFGRKRTIAHAIGKDGGERILRTVGGPSCVAKNRYGLTEEPSSDFEPVPAGKYLAVITESEMKPMKSGSGNYLQLTFAIIDDPHKRPLPVGPAQPLTTLRGHPHHWRQDIGHRHDLLGRCRAVGRSKKLSWLKFLN
jgi:hypothetical protein